MACTKQLRMRPEPGVGSMALKDREQGWVKGQVPWGHCKGTAFHSRDCHQPLGHRFPIPTSR